MGAWMSIAPPGGFGTTSGTVRLGETLAGGATGRKQRKKRLRSSGGASFTSIVDFGHAVCASAGRSREARRRHASPALAAEARAVFALHHGMAGAVVRSDAVATVPRRTQRRGVAHCLVPRGVRRGAPHRAGAHRARARRRKNKTEGGS